MHGQPNRAALVGQRPCQRLADPPVHVGAEPKPAPPVELADADLQADVAFLNKVQKRQPTVEVAPCDRHHQPQVALDQSAPGALTVFDHGLELLAILSFALLFSGENGSGRVAGLHALGERDLLGQRQEVVVGDLA